MLIVSKLTEIFKKSLEQIQSYLRAPQSRKNYDKV